MVFLEVNFLESKEPSQEGMLSNNTYDLLTQLKAENQSLWHIKNNYKRDAAGDKEALDFWDYLEKDKQDHIRKLTELLETRIRT
jgi:hypothetical protein